MTVRSRSLILLLYLTAGWPETTQATQPWKPKASVPRAYVTGTYRPLLDGRVKKRFFHMFGQGKRLIRAGRYQEASEALDQAIQLVPDHAGVRLEQARVLLTIGYLTWNRTLIQLSADHIQHALSINPSNREVRYLATLVESLLQRMQDLPPKPKKHSNSKK